MHWLLCHACSLLQMAPSTGQVVTIVDGRTDFSLSTAHIRTLARLAAYLIVDAGR